VTLHTVQVGAAARGYAQKRLTYGSSTFHAPPVRVDSHQPIRVPGFRTEEPKQKCVWLRGEPAPPMGKYGRGERQVGAACGCDEIEVGAACGALEKASAKLLCRGDANGAAFPRGLWDESVVDFWVSRRQRRQSRRCGGGERARDRVTQLRTWVTCSGARQCSCTGCLQQH